MEQKNKIHHGEYLDKLMERSGKRISEIIDLSGYSRSSIYRWVKEEVLDMEKIHQVAMACGVNVTGELEELDLYRSTLPKEKKPVERVSDVISKGKYLDTLEQLNDVRMRLEESQSRYYAMKEKVEKLEREYEKRDENGTN